MKHASRRLRSWLISDVGRTEAMKLFAAALITVLVGVISWRTVFKLFRTGDIVVFTRLLLPLAAAIGYCAGMILWPALIPRRSDGSWALITPELLAIPVIVVGAAAAAFVLLQKVVKALCIRVNRNAARDSPSHVAGASAAAGVSVLFMMAGAPRVLTVGNAIAVLVVSAVAAMLLFPRK